MMTAYVILIFDLDQFLLARTSLYLCGVKN